MFFCLPTYVAKKCWECYLVPGRRAVCGAGWLWQFHFPKDTSGKIAWTRVPTLRDDMNWDEVSFYKWDSIQRKLSCGDGDLHVTLPAAHFGGDASRFHLMNNVSYDAATLGVPGLQTNWTNTVQRALLQPLRRQCHQACTCRCLQNGAHSHKDHGCEVSEGGN